MQAKTRAQPHRPQTQPAMVGRNQKPYPSTHTQDHSQEWRGSPETKTQTQVPHKSRKTSVHSAGTKTARAMQVTRPNEVQRPGVRLHAKACDTQAPRNCSTKNMHTCLGNGIRQEVR